MQNDVNGKEGAHSLAEREPKLRRAGLPKLFFICCCYHLFVVLHFSGLPVASMGISTLHIGGVIAAHGGTPKLTLIELAH